jgi:hypothetical protein
LGCCRISKTFWLWWFVVAAVVVPEGFSGCIHCCLHFLWCTQVSNFEEKKSDLENLRSEEVGSVAKMGWFWALVLRANALAGCASARFIRVFQWSFFWGGSLCLVRLLLITWNVPNQRIISGCWTLWFFFWLVFCSQAIGDATVPLVSFLKPCLLMRVFCGTCHPLLFWFLSDGADVWSLGEILTFNLRKSFWMWEVWVWDLGC